MDTGRQKFLVQSRQSRGLRSAKHVGSNGEIELIDQTAFQQRSKQRRTAFARDRPNMVLAAQNSQHFGKIDMIPSSKMQGGFLSERGLSFPGHSHGGKNENGRAGGLKNLQSAVDPAFVGNDHAQRHWSLLPLESRLLQRNREAEPHIVALQTRVPDQDRIGQGALAKQVQFIFARGEIDRRKIPGRNLSVHRDRESGGNKGALRFSFHSTENSSTPNLQHPASNCLN